MMRHVPPPDFAVGIDVTTSLPSTQDEAFLTHLFQALRQRVPEYAPDSFQMHVVDERHNVVEGVLQPLDQGTIPELARSLRSHSAGFAKVIRGTPPLVLMLLETRYWRSRPFSHVTLDASKGLVDSSTKRRRFLEASYVLLQTCQGVLGNLGNVHLKKRVPFHGGSQAIVGDIQRGLPPVEWGYMFGVEYLGLLGLENVKRAPCEVVEELADGSYLLLLAENFETLETDSNLLERRRRQLVEHFGPDYFSYIETGQPKKVLARFLPPD